MGNGICLVLDKGKRGGGVGLVALGGGGWARLGGGFVELFPPSVYARRKHSSRLYKCPFPHPSWQSTDAGKCFLQPNGSLYQRTLTDTTLKR